MNTFKLPYEYGKFTSITLQQVLIGFLGLAFSVVIFRQSHLPIAVVTSKLQFILIAYAVGTMLQAWANRFVGSGLFLPPVSGAIYVQPSIIAIAVGGLPLLIGMTIFAGFCEFVLSFIIRRTRFIFPPEICGLVILLVGLQLGGVGFGVALKPNYTDNLIIFICTLAPIIILSVWGKGYVRHVCTIIGVVAGVCSVIFITHGVLPKIPQNADIPWLGLPAFSQLFETHIAFNWSLSLSFFLAGFAATLRTLSLTIAVQQFNNPKWRKPDFSNIQKAIRSDSITAIFAGILGVNGLNISPTATTLAIATRCTSIYISFFMSILFIILAFFPRILFYIASAPLSIVGAILVYYAAFIFTGGIRTIGAQTFGIRQVFAIGVPFVLAISTMMFPTIYRELPPPFNIIGRSALSSGLVFAVLLNLLFYIGTRRAGHFLVRTKDGVETHIRRKLFEYGAGWRLKSDLIEDSISIARELVTQIDHACLADGDIIVDVHDDTLGFTLTFTYNGIPYKMMPLQKADASQVLDEELLISGLKIYLRGTLPDEIITQVKGDECKLIVKFTHFSE